MIQNYDEKVEWIYKSGKLIGSIIGDTYYSERTEQHLMRMFNGFGVSEKLLFHLFNSNIQDIVIIYKFDGKNYRAKVNDFISSKKKYIFIDANGEDLQKFLSIEEMEIVKWSLLKS